MSDQRNLHDPGAYHKSQLGKPEDEELRREAIGEEGKPPPNKTTLKQTQRRAEAFTDQPDNVISPSPPPVSERLGKNEHEDDAERRQDRPR